MRKKVLIVSATYYEDFSKQLEMWSTKHLDNERIKNKIIQVPGVFEIPVVISKNIKKYDGFIALGCVIKGETPHFDFVSSSCANGLTRVSLDANKPVLFGVLTTETEEQAIQRADPKDGNKGAEVAQSAMELLEQFASL